MGAAMIMAALTRPDDVSMAVDDLDGAAPEVARTSTTSRPTGD